MPSQPLLAPYRENNTIKYVPTPSISSLSSPSASGAQTQTQTITALSPSPYPPNPYDSDNEPLLPTQPQTQELTADEILHFTATGRPMPVFKMSGLANLGGPYGNAPQLLPVRYTDESVIPAIVVDVIPKSVVDDGAAEPKKHSLLKKIIKEKPKKERITKVVYMPRKEYQKFFARGLEGEYIGSEPQRQWSEEELDELYGKYRPVFGKRGFGSNFSI